MAYGLADTYTGTEMASQTLKFSKKVWCVFEFFYLFIYVDRICIFPMITLKYRVILIFRGKNVEDTIGRSTHL